MPKTTKAALAQSLVLSSASEHRNGCVFPLPNDADPAAPKISKLLQSMLAAGLVEERSTKAAASTWRSDKTGKRLTLRITPAGQQAVLAPEVATGERLSGIVTKAEDQTPAPEQPRAPGGKLGQVLTAVRATNGASLADLMTMTGWQAHTIRAGLSRLRQSGVTIDLAEHDGAKRYVASQPEHASAA